MGCLGVHFAIDDATAASLRAADDDEALADLISEGIEEAWDVANLCQTDKAWDALHRCFGDGTMDACAAGPLTLIFFGGETLNEEPDYFVVLLTPDQVVEVAAALAAVDEAWLRARYVSLDFPDYPNKSDDDLAYTCGWFAGLPPFFARAAAAGRHVIFTVDQ